jgi:Type ISP C-terminal specificity domain
MPDFTILYAPTYRKRYAEILRIDFPRIPSATPRRNSMSCRNSAMAW